MKRHAIVIIGAGTAGTTVAARLERAGADDVVVVDPGRDHYYRPLWTLVGAGRANAAASVRERAATLPQSVAWIRAGARAVDPDARTVSLDTGQVIGYEHLVMAPGRQLDWDRIPGLVETLGRHGVTSSYRYDLAPQTWELVRAMTSGTAIFTQAPGPGQDREAHLRIAALAAEHWRSVGVRASIDVRVGVDLVAVDGPRQRASIRDRATGDIREVGFTMMHVSPPQSAPDWVKVSLLSGADDPDGHVEVDKRTLQHVRYGNVFALGDAASTTAEDKTAAAVRLQAPVVVANLLAVARGEEPPAAYRGEGADPLTRARLARHSLVTRHALPGLYWNVLLKGRG